MTSSTASRGTLLSSNDVVSSLDTPHCGQEEAQSLPSLRKHEESLLQNHAKEEEGRQRSEQEDDGGGSRMPSSINRISDVGSLQRINMMFVDPEQHGWSVIGDVVDVTTPHEVRSTDR